MHTIKKINKTVTLWILGICGFLAWATGASAEEPKPSPETKAPVPPKVRAVAGLRVGFMAYWQGETEMVIKAANVENHRRVDAACAALHPLSFTQGGAAVVPERARVALEKGDVDALLICMWASYPPRWYGRVGERSSLSELAALGAKNNRPPHSPTPVPVLTVSGAAGAKAIS